MSQEDKVERSDFDELMAPCYAPMSMIPVRGKGSRVWDQNDKEYIDFAGGIAVSALGHCHPVMLEALQNQGEKLWHLSNVMTNAPAIKLAKKLIELSFAEKIFFANSGAEANEAALKLARRWAIETHGEAKNEIIAFNQGFHGRTFFTVTVGGQASYSDQFGPKPQAIYHVPFNDLSALEKQMSARTCAVMMEPLQGEGGVVPATAEFIQGVRNLCNKHKALLIFDEVQTGNGRTGAFYAYQNTTVIPDILTTAKSLGGGFPIGAMLTTSSIASHLKIGTHGSTYGGNPLACAVALAVINEIAKPEVLLGVKQKEALFRTHLENLNQKYALFSQIRGQGLLLGVELNDVWHGKAREFLVEAGNQGLLILIAGGKVIRFTPSLLITEEEIRIGMERFEQVLIEVLQKNTSLTQSKTSSLG